MHCDFMGTVRRSWKRGDSIMELLKGLAFGLRKWNVTDFENIFSQKTNLIRRINGVQRRLMISRQPHLVKLDFNLRNKLEEVLK